MNEDWLHIVKRGGVASLYLFGPMLLWCLITGTAATVAAQLVVFSEPVLGLAVVIILGPSPFLIGSGLFMAYFYFMDESWQKAEAFRDKHDACLKKNSTPTE